MRIAAVDLETTDLKAFMGIVLCGSFQEIVAPGYYGNHHDTPPKPRTLRLERGRGNRFNPNPDKKLAVALRDEIESYNMIVTWNGKMFDIPFLNARLLAHGERPVHPQFHLDLMYYAGGVSNKIGSRKLKNVQQFLKLPDEKTEIDWDVWKRAALGEKEAMIEVINHCEFDVRVLAEAYWKLLPSVSTIHR